LQSQRPLAAWASWQRALRVDPESVAAAKALSTLESATELPLAARISYRFRTPDDAARRALWDERMGGGNLEDLDAATRAFDRLTTEDPLDAAAWYNEALCLAWVGDNGAAVACLDRVVILEAEMAFDDAVAAWTLAEILRQGGGAETLADDLRFSCTIGWDPAETANLLHEFPEIRQIKTPRAPGDPGDDTADIAVFEWLDRPIRPSDSVRSSDSRSPVDSQMPMVLATVFIKANSLRLSSPRAENLALIEDLFFTRLDRGGQSIRREAAPLPLPFLDADLWIFRIPPDVDSGSADERARGAIEHYFENVWIHRPRKALDEKSPLAAARDAGGGDAVARAKLAAVVRLREQLGNRVSTKALYKGYPFDRLRRRLGLPLVDAGAVDKSDLGCADPAELDRLDLGTLDDMKLLDAAVSAAGLQDDARTAQMAEELVRRRRPAAHLADWKPLISALVRRAISRDDPEAALSWIERARPMADALSAATFDVWRAEILARDGRAAPALEVYLELIGQEHADAAIALDAALTMLDNGHHNEAEQLLRRARELAHRAGLYWIERRCSRMLGAAELQH
jgi:tetratricopeptide (TPR) repeat protein